MHILKLAISLTDHTSGNISSVSLTGDVEIWANKGLMQIFMQVAFKQFLAHVINLTVNTRGKIQGKSLNTKANKKI